MVLMYLLHNIRTKVCLHFHNVINWDDEIFVTLIYNFFQKNFPTSLNLLLPTLSLLNNCVGIIKYYSKNFAC